MNWLIFLLLIVICVGLIYIVHRYFNKHEFYLISVMYSVISLILSFKLITIFGIRINMSIIFISGILIILYYFINRYDGSEIKKYIITIMTSTISTILLMLIFSAMMPFMYDETIILIRNLIFDNWPIFVLHPLSLFVMLLLCSYCFKELKVDKTRRNLKMILTVMGLTFIEVLLLVYFSYSITIKFNDALLIAIDNYFIMVIIMISMLLLINKIMKVKKV